MNFGNIEMTKRADSKKEIVSCYVKNVACALTFTYMCLYILLVSALNSSTGWRTVVPFNILIERKYIHRNSEVEICFTVFPYRELNPGHLGENQES